MVLEVFEDACLAEGEVRLHPEPGVVDIAAQDDQLGGSAALELELWRGTVLGEEIDVLV